MQASDYVPHSLIIFSHHASYLDYLTYDFRFLLAWNLTSVIPASHHPRVIPTGLPHLANLPIRAIASVDVTA